jgi:arylsulfatase A
MTPISRLFASLLPFLAGVFATAAPVERPNIVFILSDDQDWTGLSVRMHPDLPNSASDFYRTPNLEKFAAQCMRFSAAYAPAPVCSPTRISLQTGMSPAKLGWTKAAPAEGFEVFKEPKSLGFEKDAYQRADGAYLSDEFTTAGIEWMESNRDRPFFLYMAYHDVHAPYDPKPELAEKYRKKAAELGVEIDIDHAATVDALDQNVGRILSYLDEKGLAENTIVLFTSDNGGTRQYTAPLNSGKGSLYEGGIRVPFVIRGPGIRAGAKSTEPILSMDVYPTLLDFAGLPAPDPFRLDRLSLRPSLSGETGSY